MFVSGLPRDERDVESILDEFEKIGMFYLKSNEGDTFAFLDCDDVQTAEAMVLKMHNYRYSNEFPPITVSFGKGIHSIKISDFDAPTPETSAQQLAQHPQLLQQPIQESAQQSQSSAHTQQPVQLSQKQPIQPVQQQQSKHQQQAAPMAQMPQQQQEQQTVVVPIALQQQEQEQHRELLQYAKHVVFQQQQQQQQHLHPHHQFAQPPPAPLYLFAQQQQLQQHQPPSWYQGSGITPSWAIWSQPPPLPMSSMNYVPQPLQVFMIFIPFLYLIVNVDCCWAERNAIICFINPTNSNDVGR